jgi:TetR/AcrR family transcriptional regulator, mexJK operon transcriptional repressor
MIAVEARKPSQDERRAAILDIAHDAFMRDGYSGASMSRIAALVGGSKATLYSYFPSKKDLFLAVTDRESEMLLNQIFSVGPAMDDLRAGIVDLARRCLTTMLSDRIVESYRLIIAEAGRFPEIGKMTYELAVKRGLERVAAFFRQAMNRGGLRPGDPHRAADLFWDLVAGNLHKKRLWSVVEHADALAIEIEAQRIAQIFLAAYGNDAMSRAARQGP